MGAWQKSEFNLIKIHAMKHFMSIIRRSEAPIEYSANMYEHLHVALVKIAYRASNKKQFLEFIMKYNRRLEFIMKYIREGWIFSSSWKKYDIGYGMSIFTLFKIQ